MFQLLKYDHLYPTDALLLDSTACMEGFRRSQTLWPNHIMNSEHIWKFWTHLGHHDSRKLSRHSNEERKSAVNDTRSIVFCMSLYCLMRCTRGH